MENWITARVVATNEIVQVKQKEPSSGMFVRKGDEEVYYNFSELDFTEVRFTLPNVNEQNKVHFDSFKELMANMDVKAQDDHRAEIAEREYWRKLRGDILLIILKNYDLYEVIHSNKIVDTVETYTTAIYNQDKEFFKD